MNIGIQSPFPFEALPRVWGWIEPMRHRVSDDFGPQTLEQFMELAYLNWQRQKTWAVVADDELCGMIAFERLSRWLGTAHWIVKPEFQGRGAGQQASRLAVAEMFAEGIGKLSINPLADNFAMARLLTDLGAKREGTLKAQTLIDGKPIDVWVYGLTKEAFEAVKNSTTEETVCPGQQH